MDKRVSDTMVMVVVLVDVKVSLHIEQHIGVVVMFLQTQMVHYQQRKDM